MIALELKYLQKVDKNCRFCFFDHLTIDLKEKFAFWCKISSIRTIFLNSCNI